MKPRTFLNNRLLLILLMAGITAGLISWDYQRSPGQFENSKNDTTPKKLVQPEDRKNYNRDKKVTNLDDVLDELNAAEMKVTMENVQLKIAEAIKSIDNKKIQLEVEKAMQSIDLSKIQREIQTALTKVDLSKVQMELADAMKSIDMAKIKKEVQESISKVDWDNMHAELEKVKNIDLKKIQDELKELGPKMEMELKKAKIEIENAKAKIKEYKTFVDGLDSDGLIDKNKGYSLLHKDGKLFINGKKASQKTYTQYRSFLEKNKKFNIQSNNGNLKFDID